MTNFEYTQTIKKARGKKSILLKIPAFVFKLMFGEMSQIILKGTKVKSKFHDDNFEFKFPRLEMAIKNLLK